MSRGKLKLFANLSGEQFAQKLSMELDYPISPLKTKEFADGELNISIGETVRGCDVYLVQSCFDPNTNRGVYRNFFELLQTGDALKRSGAHKLTAILPYHPFARQDKSAGREPLTARLVADLIHTAGFDNIITADLHAKQIVGFYKGTMIDNLPASTVLIDYFRTQYPKINGDLVVISPDTGGAKRAEFYARELHCRAAQAFKMRSRDTVNEIEKLKVAGLVEGHNILVVDDMVDTAGSIDELVSKLKEKECEKIVVCCTHALLNGKALNRIRTSKVEIIATDTISRTVEFMEENPWYKEVSLAPLFAKAISHINKDQSVSELYEDD